MSILLPGSDDLFLKDTIWRVQIFSWVKIYNFLLDGDSACALFSSWMRCFRRITFVLLDVVGLCLAAASVIDHCGGIFFIFFFFFFLDVCILDVF